MRRQIAHDRIAALATMQHGVVSRAQLEALGAGLAAIDHRVRAGRLLVVHRGVDAVGHAALSPDGRRLAAVLACGPGAVLSHASAAALWELRPSGAQRLDVTVPTRAGRARRAGIRLHRVHQLVGEERTAVRGIPVTTVARTLLDLAAVVPRPALARAIEQADILGLFDLDALHRTLEAHRARPGARSLAAQVEHHAADATPTRSDLEQRFLSLCADHGIARPRVNGRVAGLEVDFHWPAASLVAEADGFRFHRTRAAFERDRARDARLLVAGFRVVRFTHRQITTEPAAVAATLATLGAS